ncbi:MAG TPA: hypothetical protein VH092_36690 [Urbifossiella sp.]|jgi:hypothetical protein|nr:hypothetical protein [Urbifossiella sp.]
MDRGPASHVWLNWLLRQTAESRVVVVFMTGAAAAAGLPVGHTG